MKTSELDQRICDCEEGATNTQTYREFIVQSENEFGLCNANLDSLDNIELNHYLDFLDELWEK